MQTRPRWLCVGALCFVVLAASRAARAATPQSLCDVLARSDGSTDDTVIVAALEQLRAMGKDAAPAAETLSGLLSHRSKLYRDRDKFSVVRLRAYIMVTLSDVGVPTSAMPALFDTLANLDERMSPLEIAAAARAAGSLGSRGRDFAPYLTDALSLRISPEELEFPSSETTTAPQEITRALQRIGLGSELHFSVSPRSVEKPLTTLDVAYKDHAGRDGVLRDLIDKPVLITFFYTRCQNNRKCSMAVSRMAGLQRELAQAGLADDVRLLAITYEPQFDTPERINRFATDRGFTLGPNALALQLDRRRNQKVVEEIEAPANYNAGWINTHGIELSLVDAHGRVVRKYPTLLWDNDRVVEDVKRVLAEK